MVVLVGQVPAANSALGGALRAYIGGWKVPAPGLGMIPTAYFLDAGH